MALPGRIMALDIGDVRTGVAVTDPMQIIASPHSVVQKASRAETVEELSDLVRELAPILIVAGVPLDQEGRRGAQAKKVEDFVALLEEKIDVEIVLQDERFTTASAERMLIGAGARRKKRKGVVDKVAATHILQAYLDRKAAESRRPSS